MNKEEKVVEFGKIYEEYYMIIKKYIYKKIGNSHDAEDLAGDVFYKAFKSYDGFDPARASIKTWLFCIVENRLKNFYRDKKQIDTLDENIDNKYLAEADTMAEAAALQNTRDVLADALGKLPERNRRIIILKYFYDRSAEDIARELNMTPGNVRVLSMRTLKKLEKIFKEKNLKAEDFI